MPAILAVPIGLGAVLVVVVLVLMVQRHRLARRFSKKLSPYARHKSPGIEVADPEDWIRR